MWTEAESWELMKWVCWALAETGQLRPVEEGCWAGSGCCLTGLRVWSEMTAAAAAAAVVGLEAAAVQVDADVAALRC